MHWYQFRYIIIIVLSGLSMYFLKSDTRISHHTRPSTQHLVPGSYQAKLLDIKKQQEFIANNFYTETDFDKKIKIQKAASQYLVTTIKNELFPQWLGTEYDFYGITETPGTGKIACGYFVTTVLRDAGYPIERVKMAQAASEKMIRSMVDEKNIYRFPRVKFKKFIRSIENIGEGLYVVGLDTHAGFLLYDGEKSWFIHATSRSDQVVWENAETSKSLIKSRYRVVGKLDSDEDFIRRWLANTKAAQQQTPATLVSLP